MSNKAVEIIVNIVVIIAVAVVSIGLIAMFYASIKDSRIIGSKKPGYKYNGTTCTYATSTNCGLMLSECEDGKDYACATNVQVVK